MTKQEQQYDDTMKELQINVIKARHLDERVIKRIEEARYNLGNPNAEQALESTKGIMEDILAEYNSLFR